MKASYLVGALVLATLTPHVSALAQTPDQTLPLDSQVVVGTLPNGLRYYIRRNTRPEKRAELRLAVNAGSVQEDDDQLGIAHLTEHLLFNGTRNFPKDEIIEFLQRAGMRFGADLNAYTSFDETVYMFEIPTDSAGLLEKGLQIMDDFAEGAELEDAEIDKERGVVIEEWRTGRGASMRMLNQQLPVLFKGSKYAERLPIGTKENLESFPHDALKRYYRDWYRPDLMALVVVGDFDPKQVEAWVKQYFTDNRAPATPRPRPQANVPDHAETLVSIATDKEAPQTVVSVYYLKDPERLRTTADYRRSLQEQLYGQMINNRFFELTQKADPPFIGAGAGKGSFVRGADVFSLGAAVKEDGIERGLDALLTEAARVQRHGFTESELERAKTAVLRRLENAYAEREKTESENYADEYVRHFLEEEAAPGIAYEFDLAKRLLPAITLAEMNRLTDEWMTEGNRVILVQAPEKADVQVPTEQQILALFETVQKKDVPAYVDAVTDDPLLATAPKAGSIAKETKVAEVDVTDWKLSNGVRVILKPTTFKDDEIQVSAFSPGGSSLAADADYERIMAASAVVSMGGVAGFDQVALQKKLTGRQVRVSPTIGSLEEGFNAQASPKDVETMFQLIHLYFTAPRADSVVFASWQQRLAAQLKTMAANPERAFFDTVQVTMAQGHPRARPVDDAAVQRLDLAKSLQFYRDRFADASDFTFVIVGNFSVDSIKPLVLTYLGSLPSKGRTEKWRDVGIDPPTGVITKVVRKGVEPKSRTQIVFAGPAEYTSEEAFAAQALSIVLRDNLRERLREELSGVYSPQVSGGLSRTPDQEYRFNVSFGSAPERVDELVAAMFEEISKLQNEGPTEEDLLQARQIMRREWETNLRENGYWLNALENAARFGEDPRRPLTTNQRIDAITAAAVQAAARRYLRSDNYVQVTLQPENAQAN